jgi:hypothetical protein
VARYPDALLPLLGNVTVSAITRFLSIRRLWWSAMYPEVDTADSSRRLSLPAPRR